MKRLGVGIIGLGVGERHIGGFRKHPAVEVTAICDINADVRARARQSYSGVDVLDNADALIDDARIDIVSIASFDDAHYAQVERALLLGKHVFVEKPLCLHIDEFRTIKKLLTDHPSLHLSSNLVLRASPRFQDLRQLILDGTLGRIFNIEGDYLYGRLEKLTAGWRGGIPDYSVTLGGAIHLIDLILWLTGDRVIEVTAIGNGIASEGSKFRGRDFVSTLLRFESGLVGKVSANFGCVYPHFHRLPAAAPEAITAAYPGVDKGDLIPSFVDAILGNGVAAVTEQEVLATMAVGLAIDRSLTEGRVVKIEEI